MSDKKDQQKFLADVLERFRMCIEAESEERIAAEDDLRFLDGEEEAAYETLREANIFPEVCAWLCPVEQQ